jgi:sugar lactone lactonase YvrE
LNLNTLTFDSIPTYVLGVGEVNEPWHGTVDAQGVLWITTRDGNRLGRYAPGTLSYWRWYQVPTANSGLTGITFSVKDGIWHFWFTENVSGRVGQLLLNPATLRTIRMLDMPVPAAAAPAQAKPYGIATDSAGSVWIADNGGQRIVQWVEPYYHLLQLPIVQR